MRARRKSERSAKGACSRPSGLKTSLESGKANYERRIISRDQLGDGGSLVAVNVLGRILLGAREGRQPIVAHTHDRDCTDGRTHGDGGIGVRPVERLGLEVHVEVRCRTGEEPEKSPVRTAGGLEALVRQEREVASAHAVQVHEECTANGRAVLREEGAHAGVVKVGGAKGDKPDVVADQLVVTHMKHGGTKVILGGNVSRHVDGGLIVSNGLGGHVRERCGTCLVALIGRLRRLGRNILDKAKATSRGGAALPGVRIRALVPVLGILAQPTATALTAGASTFVLVAVEQAKAVLFGRMLGGFLLHPRVIRANDIKAVLLATGNVLCWRRGCGTRGNHRHLHLGCAAANALGVPVVRVAQQVPHAPPGRSLSWMGWRKLSFIGIGRKGVRQPRGVRKVKEGRATCHVRDLGLEARLAPVRVIGLLGTLARGRGRWTCGAKVVVRRSGKTGVILLTNAAALEAIEHACKLLAVKEVSLLGRGGGCVGACRSVDRGRCGGRGVCAVRRSSNRLGARVCSAGSRRPREALGGVRSGNLGLGVDAGAGAHGAAGKFTGLVGINRGRPHALGGVNILDVAVSRKNAQGGNDVLAVTDADDLLGLRRWRRGRHRSLSGCSCLLGLGLGLSGLLLMLLPLDGALGDRLLSRGTDVLKDAEKRRNRGLVVIRAQRAGGEPLVDAIRAKRYKRNGQQDAGNPENRAKGCGQEGERLEQCTKGDSGNKPLERLAKHGDVAGKRASIQEAVMRGIVVGNNDDWPVALGDQLARGMVHGDHVLAACRRAKLGEKVPTNSKDIKNEQDARNQRQHNPQDRDARTREDNPYKHQNEKHAPHEAPAAGSIEPSTLTSTSCFFMRSAIV